MRRPKHEMDLLFASAAAIDRTSSHHVEAVIDVDLEQFLQAERERLAIDEGDVVHAERVLHRREPVELVENRLGVEAVLDLDDELQSVLAVGQVADVGDALQLARMHEVLDLRDHLLRADPVGQLGDDDAAFARSNVGDLRRCSDAKHAAAGLVRLTHAVEADDLAAGRQVGTRDVPHQVVEAGARLADQVPGRGDDLDQIVRRHVRRHADGDPGRAVDEQVRERRRQHRRFFFLAVVVRSERDHLFAQTIGHQLGRALEAALGVSVGRGRVVAAERAKVAVPVDKRHAHRERLRHAHQRVVDGRVAVRVQLAHDVADDACALHVRTIRP